MNVGNSDGHGAALNKSSSVNVSRNKTLLVHALGISNPDAASVFFVVSFIVTLGWMADTLLLLLQGVFDHSRIPSVSACVIGLLPFVFVLGIGWSRWKNARKKRIKARASEVKIEPHRGVVLFLSMLSDSHLADIQAGKEPEASDKRYSWRQCERGLDEHRERLEKVWLVCSTQSYSQFEDFVKFYGPRFPGVSFARAADSGVDFENVSDVVDTIEDIYANLPGDMDITEVMIDITGGQKPNSVAAVMAVLAEYGREFQYVQTNPPNKAISYRFATKLIGHGVVEQ